VDNRADALDRLPDVFGVVDIADEVLVVGLFRGWIVEQQLPVVLLVETLEDGLPDCAARTCE